MRIARRMYLTVVPALVGVAVVGALAYWGQYEHRVPPIIVVIAAITAVTTLGFVWMNARYVAQRVERLASTRERDDSGEADELETIELVVDRLNSAVVTAESGKAQREREAAERAHEYATLLAVVSADVAKQLEQVRLPLHILLDNHFGELNENQEEMLGAARAAADAADAEVIAMQQLADLDRGARTLRRDRILPGDVVRGLLPTLQAAAEKRGATVRADLEPLIPAIWGDQPQWQTALASLLGEAIAQSESLELELRLEKTATGCEVVLRNAGALPNTVRSALARRLVDVMGGRVHEGPGELRVRLSQAGAQSNNTHS